MRLRTYSRSALASALILTSSYGEAPKLLESSGRSVLLSGDYRLQAMPVAQNGLLAGWTANPNGSNVVYVSNLDGNRILESPLTIPEADRVLLYSVAVASDGVVAATGTAFSSQGGGVSFIAYLGASGRTSRIVRVDDFGPTRLAFAPDGRLWAVGVVMPHRNPRADGRYDTLRVYSRDGILLSTYLPSSQLVSTGHPMTAAHLAVNANAVAIYCTVTNELLTLSFDGKLTSRRAVPIPAVDFSAFGFAMSAGSRIVLSGQVQNDTAPANNGILYLDWNGGAEARRIYFRPPTTRGWGHVIGFDGEDLLVSAGLPKLEWARFR